MHAQENTVGHPSTNEDVTIEVTLTLRTDKSVFVADASYEDFATTLSTDLLKVIDQTFAVPLRAASGTDVEVSARGRVL